MACSSWSIRRLDECATFYSGGTPSKSRSIFWSGTIPWVSAKDLKVFRLYDSQDHVTNEAIKAGSRLVPAGTILLLVRGMTLHNDVPICVAMREMAFNQDIKGLIAKPGIDGDFLVYWLLAKKPSLLSSVDAAGHGTGRLNSETLKAMEVRVPPLPEQRAIANILGSLDDKIELNRRMNETLEGIARALFKSWFVDFDPVRAKMDGRQPAGMAPEIADLFPSEFEHLNGELVPKGWTQIPLDDIADFLNGLALQKFPSTGENDLPVIKIAQLRSGNTLNADRANNKVPPEFVIEDGDILFSWSGSLLVRIWCGGIGALNQHLFKVTSDAYPKWFFYHWVIEHLPEFEAIAASKATTMGHTQRHHLNEAECLVPLPELVSALDSLMAPLLAKVVANSREVTTLATLRDTLLPKLLSGELRVPDADKMVEEVL